MLASLRNRAGISLRTKFITDELTAKEDVELCFAWPASAAGPAGAHCVHATGYSTGSGFLDLEVVQDAQQDQPGGVKPDTPGHMKLRIGKDNKENLWITDWKPAPALVTNVITESSTTP